MFDETLCAADPLGIMAFSLHQHLYFAISVPNRKALKRHGKSELYEEK
jgi:hypothetical protein